jgi:galactonate dehydratase
MRLAAMQAATAGAVRRDSDLDVASIDAVHVQEPASRRTYALLRLTTRSGTRGFGECTSFAPVDLEQARRVVTGKPATAYEVIATGLGRNRLKPGIVMALLDIEGKAARAPVFQLLGGPTRNKARVVAPIYGETEAQLRASRDGASAFGYRAFSVPMPSMKWRNNGQAFVKEVQAQLDSLRGEGAGDYVLNGDGALTPGDAASISAAVERFHPLWFDEPCAVSNLGAVRKLAEENVTPLGFGRTVETGGGFQDLLREDAVDILRPDLGRVALTEIRRIAALAETYYIAIAPHHAGGPVATAAALHLAASLPNFFIQEIPHSEAERDQKMRAEITGGSVEKIKDGFAALPTGPGLGITVNEEAAKKYEVRL